MQNAFIILQALLLAAFLVLAHTGVLGFGQGLAHNPFWSTASLVLCVPYLKLGRASRPLLAVCALWAVAVWSNLIFAGHQKLDATVTNVDVHIAVSNKDHNWACLDFRTERGAMREYFPIQARQLEPGDPVTLVMSVGPFWPRIESVQSQSWSGSASFF